MSQRLHSNAIYEYSYSVGARNVSAWSWTKINRGNSVCVQNTVDICEANKHVLISTTTFRLPVATRGQSLCFYFRRNNFISSALSFMHIRLIRNERHASRWTAVFEHGDEYELFLRRVNFNDHPGDSISTLYSANPFNRSIVGGTPLYLDFRLSSHYSCRYALKMTCTRQWNTF